MSTPTTLKEFRRLLKPVVDGQQSILEFVTKAPMDDEFIAAYLKPEECRPSKVLYEDPELGFCICGHVHEDGMDKTWPHDYGTAWAIYRRSSKRVRRSLQVNA